MNHIKTGLPLPSKPVIKKLKELRKLASNQILIFLASLLQMAEDEAQIQLIAASSKIDDQT